MELQNVLANTPEKYETEYGAHYHIKTALNMFDKFVDEYEAVLQENQALRAKLEFDGVKGVVELPARLGDMKINGNGNQKEPEIKKKDSKEYLGYYVDENGAKGA